MTEGAGEEACPGVTPALPGPAYRDFFHLCPPVYPETESSPRAMWGLLNLVRKREFWKGRWMERKILNCSLPSLVPAACVWHRQAQGSAKPACPDPHMQDRALFCLFLGGMGCSQHMGAAGGKRGQGCFGTGPLEGDVPSTEHLLHEVLCYFPAS